MNRFPSDVGRLRLSIDCVSENIEHAGKDSFAYGRFQSGARVFNGIAAGKALRRRKGDTTNEMRVELR